MKENPEFVFLRFEKKNDAFTWSRSWSLYLSMQVFGPNICAFLNIRVPLSAHPVRWRHDGILFLEISNNQNALDDNLEK